MNTATLGSALSSVIDPELGLDIVSLGLVYGIDIEDESIELRMALTSAECPMGELLATMAGSQLARAGEGREVSIEIVDDPPWSPAMMSPEAQARLGIRS